MMDRDIARSARNLAGLSARGIGPLLLGLIAASAVQAREVTFPKDHPKISMNVPDDWSVDYTDFGLEIRSPEKKLFIVADVLPRQKAQADGWAKKAVAKIEQFGVKFGVPAGQPAQRDTTKQAVATKPVEPAPAPPEASPASTSPSSTGSATKAPVDRSAPSFTFLNPPTPINPAPAPAPDAPAPMFFGAPSLDTPRKPEGQLAVKTDIPAGMSIEQLTMKPSSQRPKIPFKVGSFPNGTLDGQAVDVQIVNFGLSSKELFLVLQASLSTDDRAVDVIQSVKPAS